MRFRGLVVVLLALLAPVGAAQDARPVLVDAASPLDVETTVARPAEFRFELLNLNSAAAFFVSVDAVDLDAWSVRAEPDRFFLDPRASANVTVALVPAGAPAEFGEGSIRFTVVNGNTGEASVVEHEVTVLVSDAARVLDVFPNPLPPPLDNAYGVFVLDLAFWAAIGVAAFLLGDTVVRYLTRFASRDVTRAIIQKLRWPVFWFVVLIGLKQSVDVLPRNPVTVFAARFLAVVAVGVVGFYVAYRILEAALFYYSAEIAPRTASQVDDVLVPAIRKIGVVVVFIVAIGYTLAVFGFNPAVLFGAAGIMGLVIAFAAQDTLSNFFSGIFILLDRPFREGDDVQIEKGEICRVDQIGLRSTRLYHYRNHEVIVVPNNHLASNRIVNLATPDTRFRINIEFGVAYDTDVVKLREVCLRVLRDVPEIDWADEPQLILSAFGESSLNYLLRFYIKHYRDRVTASNDARHRLLIGFREHGIEIPFPQRVLHVVGESGEAVAIGRAPPRSGSLGGEAGDD